jgi:hypothetical protein
LMTSNKLHIQKQYIWLIENAIFDYLSDIALEWR